jgi:steroid delta-isomerase-like uncharacterized protein
MSTEENKAIARRHIAELWNQGKLDVADEFYAGEFVMHDPSNPDRLPGPEGTKQMVAAFLAAFPDLHVTIEDLIAEGDKVVTRVSGTGTHRGEYLGIPPTGKKISFTGISIFRLVDGKYIEGWQNMDTFGTMQQLGAIPPLGEG